MRLDLDTGRKEHLVSGRRCMDYESIRKLIENNKSKTNFGEFGHGASDEWIEKAQSRLGVRFPPSYVWWLKSYKGGEINGDEIFSVYELDFDSVIGGDIVYINELRRKKDLSTFDMLYIQKNDFGEDYYIDLSQVDDQGESPINMAPLGVKYADNFLHFLERKIGE